MKGLNEIISEATKVKTKQLKTKINKNDYKGKVVITYGTYDLFHVGHSKIIEHAIDISGDESNVIIAVSSDRWNSLKGKKSFESEDIRIKKIKEKYPRAKVILEDHDKPEETWDEHWDEYNISLIVMGGDHVDNLDYINTKITPKGNEMKIVFYERTPKISSTLIRNNFKDGGLKI